MSKFELNIDEFINHIEEGYTIIDFRDADDFILGFIPNSIYVKYKHGFQEILELFITQNQYFLFIANEGEEETILNHLHELKYSNVIGYLKGGFLTWLKHKYTVDVVISIDEEEFELEYKHGNLYLMDLRPEFEFKLQYLKNSQNIDIELLLHNYDAIEDQVTNCIYCLDGELSLSMISYLKSNAKHNLYHISGGFNTVKKIKSIILESDAGKEPDKKSLNLPL